LTAEAKGPASSVSRGHLRRKARPPILKSDCSLLIGSTAIAGNAQHRCRRARRVVNAVLPEFVKSGGAKRDIINESLPAQNVKPDAASSASPPRADPRGSSFVKDISSLRRMRDTHRKEYRFNQSSA
jgi:hypothetical protein